MSAPRVVIDPPSFVDQLAQALVSAPRMWGLTDKLLPMPLGEYVCPIRVGIDPALLYTAHKSACPPRFAWGLARGHPLLGPALAPAPHAWGLALVSI